MALLLAQLGDGTARDLDDARIAGRVTVEITDQRVEPAVQRLRRFTQCAQLLQHAFTGKRVGHGDIVTRAGLRRGLKRRRFAESVKYRFTQYTTRAILVHMDTLNVSNGSNGGSMGGSNRGSNDWPRWLPRSLRARLAGLGRDLHMIREGLAGRQPSPVEIRPRKARHAAQNVAALAPRTLRVKEVVRETAAAVTLHLVDESGAPFAFEAGQFLTLLLPLGPNGELVRRAYSASSSPSGSDGAAIAITSKRVAGGRVSNYLNDEARAGMSIQVLGPSGNFTPLPRAEKRRHVVLLGGGSGITPLMSIAETLLHVETASRVSLIYGNRRHEDIIFFDRLAALSARHADRFVVRHVLAEPPEGFACGVGLLDEAVLESELAALAASASPALPSEYYVCGPEPMMAAARGTLKKRGVDPRHIFEERFATLRYGDEKPNLAPQPMELRRGGQAPRSLTVLAGETLLDAGLRDGAALPFSCAMGGCGACKGRLVTGDVVMPEPNCLSAAERQAGYILCCVARPTSPVSVEVP